MTNYAKQVLDTNNQVLQNFISDSPWDEEPVIDKLQKEVIQLIGDKHNGSLHIDESGFKKSGNNSVRVKRQYCGRLCKIDNCQIVELNLFRKFFNLSSDSSRSTTHKSNEFMQYPLKN